MDEREKAISEIQERISLKLKAGEIKEADELSAQLMTIVENPDAELPSLVEAPPIPQVSYPTPAAELPSEQTFTNEDREHLRMLGIFHFVVAGIIFVYSSFFLIHFGMGVAMFVNPQGLGSTPTHPIPFMLPLMFTAIGGIAVLCGWSLAVANVMAGRYLRSQKRHTFCLVVASLDCMHMPFGTVLGVFTLIKLLKKPVKDAFLANQQSKPNIR